MTDDPREERLAQAVNFVRQLRLQKKDAVKAMNDEIDEAQSIVDKLALEIIEGQGTLPFGTEDTVPTPAEAARELVERVTKAQAPPRRSAIPKPRPLTPEELEAEQYPEPPASFKGMVSA